MVKLNHAHLLITLVEDEQAAANIGFTITALYLF